MRATYDAWRFNVAIRRFAADPEGALAGGSSVLAELISAWGNAGWSAQEDYLRGCVGQALEHAEDGREVHWRAPNGYDYEVVPRRTYTGGNGEYCREYTTTAVINGRADRVYGSACRNADGSWRLVS